MPSFTCLGGCSGVRRVLLNLLNQVRPCVGSAPPFYFGTGHVAVLTAPPWKMVYSGVRQHRCSSALDFCSACLEWKELREQLNQVCPWC